MIKLFQSKQFYFSSLQSPTYFNLNRYLTELGWKSTRFSWLAQFGEKNFEFNPDAAETLEFKHLLAQLIIQYCPEVMPETYYINDTNWHSILSHISEKYYIKNHHLQDQVSDLVWILKPALLNNGQNIKIFQTLSQIEQHYLSSKRLGGDHVLQRYITHPHLLNNKKYSVRMFVIVTNDAGSYLYRYGYLNVALNAYQAGDFKDLKSHLTNEHLTEPESNVIQVPTQSLDYLFIPTYQKIKLLITSTLNALQHSYPQAFIKDKTRKLAIFGFDFMLDADLRVWLLEANHGPCFPTSDVHPLQFQFYEPFWKAFIESFAIPIATRESMHSIRYPLFESL